MYPFKATIKEEGTEEEVRMGTTSFSVQDNKTRKQSFLSIVSLRSPQIIQVERPCKCAVGSCKCCCYQELSVHSSEHNTYLGKIVEQFFWCVPRFVVFDAKDKPVYKLHQPTCCGGACVDCCAEGNPCGKLRSEGIE